MILFFSIFFSILPGNPNVRLAYKIQLMFLSVVSFFSISMLCVDITPFRNTSHVRNMCLMWVLMSNQCGVVFLVCHKFLSLPTKVPNSDIQLLSTQLFFLSQKYRLLVHFQLFSLSLQLCSIHYDMRHVRPLVLFLFRRAYPEEVGSGGWRCSWFLAISKVIGKNQLKNKAKNQETPKVFEIDNIFRILKPKTIFRAQFVNSKFV